jgi:hypothetical protein
MSSRVKITADTTQLTIEELASLSPRTMQKVLRAMPEDHRKALLSECERKIVEYGLACTRPGYECADSKIVGFTSPYTMLKKYSHMYTCLAGFQTAGDLEERMRDQCIALVEEHMGIRWVRSTSRKPYRYTFVHEDGTLEIWEDEELHTRAAKYKEAE